MDIVVQRKPDLKNAFAILERYSSDPEKRRQIEEKIKADRDYAYDLAGSFEDGLEQGEKRGLEMGEKKKALEDARKILEKGYTLKDALELTGLSEKDLRDQGII